MKIQFETDLFAQELKLLCRQNLSPNWKWIASSSNTRVAYNSAASVYYKEFLPRNRWEGLKKLLRGSRCARAVKLASTLKKYGFKTPRILCSGKLDQHREYMVSEAVNAVGVASYLASYLRQTRNTELIHWKRKVITALGSEIGKLHAQQIIHGDLRPNNILIELGKDSPSFYFIDNERTRHWLIRAPKKLIRKNLMQIGMLFPVDISKTDRLRFWHAYCQRYSPYRKNTPFMYQIYSKTISRLITTPHYKPREPDLPKQYLDNGLIIPKNTKPGVI